MEEPPAIAAPAQSAEAAQVAGEAMPSGYDFPTTQRPDGSLVIDLTPLAPQPVLNDCLDENPDPFNPTILVCEKTKQPDPRLGPVQGPSNDELFGSAIPRARLKLSDNAAAEANAIKKSVGGFDADGGEVRVKIEF